MQIDKQEKHEPALFITGSSGFVGKRLLQLLNPAGYARIDLLNRHKIQLPAHLARSKKVRQIVGNLDDTESYSHCLGPGTRIIHLAAVTGKAEREAYFRTNTQATEKLIHAAEKAGVHGFLLVSSFAVSFKRREGHYYAESKQLAEQSLQSSRLRYTIVRPTMILGQKSPALKNLSCLAKGPIIFQPGSGRIPIQPVDVDDLSELLLAITREDAFRREILEFGGPEKIEMQEFLQKIHIAHHQKRGIVFRLPLRLIIVSLRILEKAIGKYLPVSSGQFASFCNPGTIQPNHWFNTRSCTMKNIDAMLYEPNPVRNEKDRDFIAAECSIYTRYLADQEPDSFVQRKYAEAFETGRPLALPIASRFESLLERISRKNALSTRAVDGYCKLFYRNARVRKKLVLLLAILESRAETARSIDRPDDIAPPLLLLTFFTRIARAVLLLVFVTILFSPIRIVLNGFERLFGSRHG
ncbi:MAG: NAD-dependent epimerase/dehydratase family protein [Gammaproteobacteria bacterium]